MRKSGWAAEVFGIYAVALTLVWVLRHTASGLANAAWWIIPFLWILAASLPGLWQARPWLSWEGLVGAPRQAAREVLQLSVIVFPVFGVVFLAYFGADLPPRNLSLPPDWGVAALYQIVYIGFSEELFFRGFIQQRLDQAWGRPFDALGIQWGFGLIIANVLFAAGHAIASGNPAQADVFVPGLLFGWLQARTGAVLAPAVFHGLSNLVLLTLQNWTTQ